MRPETSSTTDGLVMEFVGRVSSATDEIAARNAYRDAFSRLRQQLVMYPAPGARPSQVFESAAKTARALAATCLPLGTAVAMHLYPLCALQCIPLPFLSPARLQRAMLLHAIRSRSWIVANAGSERSCGSQAGLVATPETGEIRIDGTCDYMSLASVADIVFFQAKWGDSDRAVLCAADLRADSVHIGSWKFQGRMRLSDTASVTFSRHRVPRGRYLLVANGENLRCTSNYQRCWFQLFIAEVYVARIERLRDIWRLPPSVEYLVSLNEIARLREYSLHLLDDFHSQPNIEALLKTTTALKLRVSLLAQATITALHDRALSFAADAEQLRADAGELVYIKSQPTADAKILREMGAMGELLFEPRNAMAVLR